MTEFRHADPPVADGVRADGLPWFSTSRLMTDRAGVERLFRYLDGAPVVRAGIGFLPDALAPHRRFAVPTEFHTDGVWLWPGAVPFYLRWHGVALPPAFRRHIVANGYTCPPVPPEILADAAEAAEARVRDLVVLGRERRQLERRQGDSDGGTA